MKNEKLDEPQTAAGAPAALAELWGQCGLPPQALVRATLSGSARGFASSFAVADLVQASVGAAALAATEIGALRRPDLAAQTVSVDAQHAVFESSGFFTLDGQEPDLWSPISGLYACGAAVGAPGWVRIHANFDHHRDGALALLGLPTGSRTPRAAVAQALQQWRAEDFEARAAECGLPVAALRSHEQWLAQGQQAEIARQPLVELVRIGDAAPLAWPRLGEEQRPLAGIRMLDLTRILSGPAAARTLAAYGAEVLMINGPHLPNIGAIADLSRGKRSAQLDLRTVSGRADLRSLVGAAHVFLQAYRPGALEARGFGAEALARLRPGLVVAELCAYGWQGPWSGRRGFDSLVQTASGINADEGMAEGGGKPRVLPMQALDYGAGFLLAFGIQAALLKQAAEGGSWRVRVTLAGAAHWLRSLARVDQPQWQETRPEIAPYLETLASGFGRLQAVRHCAQFSRTPVAWDHSSMPPGSQPPRW
ncbi:CoA transferase [Comamonas guangdongensis]|uniref:CoA transferase n=1 Tax=Comamonas guangdongensis TaxID=510515 RepID=A0ABV3ZUN4_9BURK